MGTKDFVVKKGLVVTEGATFASDDFLFTSTAGSEQLKVEATSDTTLVKIVQLGTGNVLEVHDQATDTSAFFANNAGKVGILKNPGSSLTYDVEIGGETLSERFTSSVSGSASSPAFRFSSDTNNGMYLGGTDILGFSTAGTERMTISAAGKIHIGSLTSPVTEGMLTISRDDTTATGATLLLLDGDDDANNGPLLKMYRDSASPADDDNLGSIGFNGEDSAGGERTYAKITAIAKDVTSGTNDGSLEFKTMVAGTQETGIELEGGAVTFNEAYTFPTTVTGANDRVLTAQTNGTTAWAAVSATGRSVYDMWGQVYGASSGTSSNYVWIQPNMHARGSSTNNFSGWTQVHYIPMWSYQGGATQYGGVYVSTAVSGASLKLGIYSAQQSTYSGGYYPDTLLCSGTIDCSSTGNKVVQWSASTDLDPSTHYFMGFVWANSNYATIRAQAANTMGAGCFLPMADSSGNLNTPAQCGYNGQTAANNLPSDGMDNGSGGTANGLTRRDSNYLPKVHFGFASASGNY